MPTRHDEPRSLPSERDGRRPPDASERPRNQHSGCIHRTAPSLRGQPKRYVRSSISTVKSKRVGRNRASGDRAFVASRAVGLLGSASVRRASMAHVRSRVGKPSFPQFNAP
ncbi:Hypothetical protein A7982_00133 [Minicystis rosea]|nr:Hypothetical protein A7982_00133 [Minicystis rosea]